MKIGVCIKQVPSRESELAVNAAGTWVNATDSYDSSEPDNYALEAGLLLKEQHGGEVVVILLGPASATETVKTSLAKGADRAIHILNEELERLDPLQIAGIIAESAREEQFDLILTGLQSDDLGFGQTGVLLAELLGIAHSTVVVDIQVDGDQLHLKRELEAGWSQSGTMSLPGVLTVQSGINSPRYATFKAIIAAKRKEIRSVPCPDALPASQQLVRLYVPEVSKHTQMLDGSPAEQAAALINKLKNEARVLS